MRRRISFADLLVKVTQSMFEGRMPTSFTRYANLCARARVLPLPAPAITRTKPSVVVTASRCSVFSPLSISLIFPPLNKRGAAARSPR